MLDGRYKEIYLLHGTWQLYRGFACRVLSWEQQVNRMIASLSFARQYKPNDAAVSLCPKCGDSMSSK